MPNLIPTLIATVEDSPVIGEKCGGKNGIPGGCCKCRCLTSIDRDSVSVKNPRFITGKEYFRFIRRETAPPN